MAARPSVLLIDDDDALRRSVRRALRAIFEVTEAEDGTVALQILEERPFEVIVTDLEMPHLGGDGVFGWLEANRPALLKRVIVCTGGASTAARAEWLRSFDPTRVLEKPCTSAELIAAIEAVLKAGDP